MLISGAPGVGKTALAGELRTVVASGGGWLVTGKFDQYRRDLEFDATHQAFRALGRLLLAEPDDELAKVRERVLAAVGPNAGLLAAAVPEFAALLAVPPEPGDPLTARARAQLAAARALRAVAAKERPVLIFLDDLQWAGAVPLGLVDLMLSEEPAEGLLLVGAYRDGDVDSGHPLVAALARWRGQPMVRHLRLASLDRPSLATMVAEMLHADQAEAADLADAIEPRTHGNPYETVELLNALRRDGALAPTPAGWRWQAGIVRARLNRPQAGAPQEARLAAMPRRTRAAVEAMACLGGRAELSVLRIATGTTAGEMAAALEPAIEDGLLVLEPGTHEAVRFRHDRIREAVVAGIEPERRRALQLVMARRLAAVPELFAVAAEQYLPVADTVDDTAERRAVAVLLARAADQAAMIGDYRLMERPLTTALALTEPDEAATVLDLRTRRHAALYSLGRFDEADRDYAVIDALTSTVLDRPEATAVQMTSLTNRGHSAEATDLGSTSLRECGITVPAADGLAAEVGRQLDHMYWWLNHTDADGDPAHAEVTDPGLVTAGRLLSAMLASTFFVDDPAAYGWVGLLALRIWTEHGAARTLVAPAINAAFSAIARRGDYAAAYRVARRVLALSEARGYVPDLSHARHVISLLQPWFEPVENSIPASQQAREGLLAQAALRRVATLVARGAPPGQVFAAVAEEVGRLVTATFAVLIRYEQQDLEVVGQWTTTSTGGPAPTSVGTWLPLGGRNVSTLVHQTGQPARIDYAAGSGVISQVAGHDWGFRSSVGVPVSVEGRLWGVMIVAFADAELPPSDIETRLAGFTEPDAELPPSDIETRLAGFTELVATAIANAEARAEAIASRARIVAAADQARRRIERDLHDGAQQRLVTLALQLRGTRAAVPPELAELGVQLDHAIAGVTGALDELREIARGIHPAILADGGLRPALRALARRSPIPVRVDVHLDARPPEQVEVSAYYVVAEALTNAARHTRASAVSVEADVAGDALRIAISDDGAGGASFTGGTGLAGLKDRVEALGGRIFLDSPAGAGTSLRVELPLTSASTGVTSR